MKMYYLLFIVLLTGPLCYGRQAAIFADTSKNVAEKKEKAPLEMVPEHSGGMTAFQKYISKHLRYPDVANLIGIDGRVVVSFTVERDGKISNVYPLQCIGAGCESEAVKVIADCKPWKPGFKDGMPVRVTFSVPIDFHNPKDEVTLRSLRNSDYGFIFNIKGELYTIDDVQKLIGRSFSSKDINIAVPFYNYNHIDKFDMPGKKEVYLLIFKSS